MRKTIALLFFAMFLLSGTMLYAQERELNGSLSAELNGNLFVQDEILITPTFIKLRYFVSDKAALRLTTWFDFSSDQKVPESTLNHSYFAARPGVEFHLASQPGSFTSYIGLEVIVDHASHEFDTKVGVPVSGAWSIDDITNFKNRGYFSLGTVVLGGGEYYLGGTVYLGSELGIAYTRTTHAEVSYGTELFLAESKTSTVHIDLSRIIRIGFMIN